ncbi:MAG TPA: DUF5666 domain-containing protein [Gammaproteobacteria bacterium]|nr:DUF5666 domain-containing protein [Gammaproteobacteria bacterium]
MDARRMAPARFEGMASTTRLAPRYARAFAEYAAARGQALLEEIDAWLLEHKVKSAGEKSTRGIRAGFGADLIRDEMQRGRRDMTAKTKLFLCCLLAALSLTGCGGGSGGPSGDFAGIDRTGAPTIAFGPVAGFGSVIVNGVRYDTSKAAFRIDGRVGTQNELEVGDVVTVTGIVAAGGLTGTADTVTFDDNVEGPIAAIDAAAGTLLVLGQTVIVDADTSFDDSIRPASLGGLAVGDVIEVSGLVASDGSIHATRIEERAAGQELEITGVVASHDAAAKRFKINALIVDYSAAMLSNFPSGMVADGQLVEVKGTTVTAGVLAATRVELEAGAVAADAGARAEVEGLITRFVSATDFAVAGVSVTTNAQTAVTGGTAADLGLNVKVEVEGTVGANGVLAAAKVDIRRDAGVRLTAQVDSVNATAGSLVMLGITVHVDALTRIEDKSSIELRPFSLANLSQGDYVEVRGVPTGVGSGEVLALRLERENLDTRVELRGAVQTVADPAFSVLSVQVATGPGAVFRAAGGASLTATQFFAQLATGVVVDVKGVEIASKAIQASEVQLGN